jgi:pyruvate-formate lyase-activating enzyme
MSVEQGHIVIFAIPAKFLMDLGIKADMNQTHLCEVPLSRTHVDREGGFIFSVHKEDPLHNLKFHQLTFANKTSANESEDLCSILSIQDDEDNYPEIYAMADDHFSVTVLKLYNMLLDGELDA